LSTHSFLRILSVAVMATSLSAGAVFSQQSEEGPETTKSIAADELSQTSHSVQIGGANVDYSATAGRLVLRHPDGEPRGHMFFVAYTRDGQDLGSRPITFAYNGGPGSATVWLHMGVLGPKVVKMASEGFQPAPPYELIDNEHSLLDVTDIVAIDAMSTGFSRAAEGEDAKQFHGVRQDIEAFSEFIRLYLTKFGRWSSPKYLLGESYGTVRSAGVSALLQSRHGIELNGIVLVSSVIDFSTLRGGVRNDGQYPGFLPTYTVTAWYHKKLPADLMADFDKTVAEAREFAYGDYLVALNKGNRLTPSEWNDMAERMARYTGLSPEFIKQSNLRISPARYRKELLRDQRLVVGRLDSRFTAIDRDAAGERQEFDPSNTALQGAYTSLFNEYVRTDLGWESEDQYFTSGNVRPWDYGDFANGYLNLLEELRKTMARNPFVRVLVTNGYYDMATPFAATEWTFDHLGYEPTYRERVSMAYYEAGHMMYIHPDMLRKFKEDVARFIEDSKSSMDATTEP